MIDTLTDTLMALWNTTWRGKILPGLIAFIIVGICMSLFFLLIKLPTFSHQQPTTLNSSEKKVALSPHNGDIPVTVVTTPTPTLAQMPTSTPIQASDVPVPALAPVPMPVQLPGITSDPNVASASNTDIGSTDINSYAPLPAPTNNINHPSIRHIQPTAKIVSAPPVLPTAVPTPPPATATAIPTNNTPASTTSVTPTVVMTPTPIPTSIVVATPTVVIPTVNPAPTPTYPATSPSGGSPTVAATATLAPAVTATPTANTSVGTGTVVSKPTGSA